MDQRPNLSGPRLKLRSPIDSDVVARHALGQDAEILRMFGYEPAEIPPYTMTQAQNWIDRIRDHSCAWIVEYDGQLLGEIRLDKINLTDQRANLAIGLLDTKKLGKGLGREAIQILLGYAFGDLKLHRVGLRVISYNERAIRCYLACGFVREGIEREAALVGKKRYDDVIMGILATEHSKKP